VFWLFQDWELTYCSKIRPGWLLLNKKTVRPAGLAQNPGRVGLGFFGLFSKSLSPTQAYEELSTTSRTNKRERSRIWRQVLAGVCCETNADFRFRQTIKIFASRFLQKNDFFTHALHGDRFIARQQGDQGPMLLF
jgi:hypothetical protein